MTLNQLRYFRTLAETGHMGKAAERLYISAPSLSVAMGKLEEEMGVALFDRSGRGIALTDDGRLFLSHTERILAEVAACVHHMDQIREEREGIIRVGCIAPLLSDYLPERMRAFLEVNGNEGVRFVLESGGTDTLSEKTAAGLLDLSLCQRSSLAEVNQIPVMNQPVVLICKPGDPVRVERWEDLRDLPLVGYDAFSAMDRGLSFVSAQVGVPFTYAFRVPDEAAIANFVARGFGVAVVPEVPLLRDFPVEVRPLPPEPGKDQPFYRTVWLTRAQSPLQGAAGRFADFLLRDAEGIAR